jgi:uncharacterized protein
MDMQSDIAIQRPADSSPASWLLLGTICWGIAVGLLFAAIQVIATLIVVLRGQGDLDEEKLLALVEAAPDNGFALSIATFATTLICVPVVIGIAKLKKHSDIGDYFALKPVSVRSLLGWVGVLIIFIALADGLTLLLGKPVVHESMTASYNSARSLWLLWLALVVAAPLFEEIFFRGFLFRGFASSRVGPLGAIGITALLWAAIHLQYDLYGMGVIFFLGLLLGFARMSSGSLVVPLTLHAVSNIVATVETTLLG